MAKNKVDLTKPYGTIYGSTDGSRYEQDGKIFNAQGEEMTSEKPAKAQKAETTETVVDEAYEALKAEAKQLGIKSPHLFKPEALALKVEEAKLTALQNKTQPANE